MRRGNTIQLPALSTQEKLLFGKINILINLKISFQLYGFVIGLFKP
jgi:hypothetical protein